VQTARHAFDTDLSPESHGAAARLMITIGLETIADRLAESAVHGIAGVGVSGDGTELSAATVRRLACDAEVIPTVLGGHGQPLDVGRAKRLVTLAIWVALMVRDQHCAFPGCDRPPMMCHAHHIRHWIFGGKTSLDNLVLLCGHHHRVIHDSPWAVRINPADNKPEFLPPAKFGIEQTWQRHRSRRE
jgi:hypothetical protein